MSESTPPRRISKRITLILSVLASVSFTLCRLGREGALPTAFVVEQAHVNQQPSPFEGAFPSINITDSLESFSNLAELVQLQNLPVPRNLNILFMGDSLTRYQYLDLVYFLSHNGTWPSPDDRPNMVVEKTHRNGWTQFYNFTKSALHPYEQCDCFREFNLTTLIENRYYHDPVRNNRVTYLQKFGKLPFKSNWNVTEVHQEHTLVKSAAELNFVHQDANWVDAIQSFVCHLSPKPSLFIFNAGLWTDHDLKDVGLQRQIVGALQACHIPSMFKTTTKPKTRTEPTWEEYERQLCNLTDYCMDVRWTALVPESYYWDWLHFYDPIYSMLNVQLLSMITSRVNFDVVESVS